MFLILGNSYLDPRQCSEESPEFGSFRPSVYPDVFLERAIQLFLKHSLVSGAQCGVVRDRARFLGKFPSCYKRLKLVHQSVSAVTFCKNFISGKILIHVLQPETVLSNHIVGFFHQRPWNGSINILEILHGACVEVQHLRPPLLV